MSVRNYVFAGTLCLSLASSWPALAQHQVVTPVGISVSPLGTLQLRVPIKLPAGINGLQPDLAMLYDSGGSVGNAQGGWNLVGIPRITRCAKTFAQDGIRSGISFSDSDAFCLDGERLILVRGAYGAGGEYRTERDTFAKITFSDRFDVQTKSGRSLVFDFPFTSIDGEGPIKAWGLTSMNDHFGNSVNIKYSTVSRANYLNYTRVDDGIFNPTQINYLRQRAQVDLSWFDPKMSIDSNILYAGGFPSPRSEWLRDIYAWSKSFPTDQQIDYAQCIFTPNTSSIYDALAPMLNKMVQCNYLPEVSFQYEPFQNYENTIQELNWNSFPGDLHDYKEYFVDVDGNGKKSWIRISQASDEAWIGVSRLDGTFTSSQWTRISSSVGPLNSFEHYFADVNGDGKMDWIRVSRTTDEAWVALGQGGGSFHFWTKYLPGVGSANANAHFFADLDGDGRADWIQISRTSNVVKLAFASLSGDFATWTMPAQQIGLSKAMSYFADVNGDGKADWITLSEYMMTANLSNGDGTFSAATSTSVWPAATCIFADVNGDKNQDAICSSEGPNKYVIYNFISKGDGTFKPQVRLGSYDGPVLMSDLNADGMADRISIVENGAAFFYWPTIPVQSPYPYPISLSAPSAPNLNYSSGIDYYFEDINGDGKPDLIIVDRANRNGFVGLNMLNNMYRITSIADPVHGTTTIEYKPVTDPSVYTSDTDGVYPLRDAIFPLPNPTARMPFVVSAVTSPDGKGGTLTTRYTYGGMKTDVLRNQNLGFRWMKATQVESGISTYTEFKQVWPYTGLVASTTTTGPSGSLLNQVINTYGCTDFVSTSGCTVTPGRRYFPFLSQSVVSAWDAKGIALPTTTITKKYDSFGNVTREVTSSSDGYSKTVDTEYMNDINKWWIGRPVRETVTNTSP